MKKLLLFFLVLAAVQLLGAARSRAQCVPTPGSGACFRAYDRATGKELSAIICAGRPFSLRDCSGRNLDPAQIFYVLGPATACTGFRDTTTTFTINSPGPVTITQNTQGAPGATQGVIFSRAYRVIVSPPPVFTVTACGASTVEVTVQKQDYDQYSVEVDGQTYPIQPGTPTQFPGSGATPVKVTGQYSVLPLCSGSTVASFTPLPAPEPPRIQRLTVQGTGGATLQFRALQPEYQYVLQVADATAPDGYRTLTRLNATQTSFTLPATSLPGCFRLLLTDACQRRVTVLGSPLACSAQLTAASANGRNQLRFITEAVGAREVLRDGQPLLTLPASATGYEDTTAVCGTSYRYQLLVRNPFLVSESNEVSVTTTPGPVPAPPRLLASFNLRNQVELTATVARTPTGGQLTYLRNGTELRATAARTLRDSALTFSLADPLCYVVRFLDACGNRSADSPPVCPVLLEARSVNETGTQIRLNWTALRGPSSAAVSYELLTLSATNAVLSRRPVNGALTYLDVAPPPDERTVRYRIEAVGAGLLGTSYSNVTEVTRQLKLFVPTAFTPNGDGLNDVLELKGQYLDNFRFVIIDRNGQEVFRATSRTQTWDGRIGAAPPAPGAYVWRFEATDINGKRLVQHGSVTILR